MPLYNPGTGFSQGSPWGIRPDPFTGLPQFHGGTDFRAPIGTPIPVAAGGTVIYSGGNTGLGNTVIVQHIGADGNPFYTLYAHMNGIGMPAVGAQVNVGDIIGEVGNTGYRTTGPHLHFEIVEGVTPSNADGGPIGFWSNRPRFHPDPAQFNNWPGSGPYDGGSPSQAPFSPNDPITWFAPWDDVSRLDDLITYLKDHFGTAEITRSPIILDLNGDGVRTISESEGPNFDLDGNRFAEQTGWVSKDDGLLVWDRNSNGEIDDGSELFGNYTQLGSGSNAANGFAALADLDSNHDGKVDASDAAFADLRVWKDGDSNGFVSTGELLSLADAGVQSLGVNFSQQNTIDAQGNQHLQAGQYIGTDGLAHAMDDVWFAVDTARTVDLNQVEVSAAIEALPDVAGFGNVSNLHEAMARDATGRLQTLVQSFVSETDPTVRDATLTELIYVWAGVDGVDPNSRAASMIYGNAIGDARKLATLEAFLGQAYLGTWCWGVRDPNPHEPAARILLPTFDELADYVRSQLMAQTDLKDLYDSVGLVWNSGTSSYDLDVTAVISTLQAEFTADAAKGLLRMTEFGSTLKFYGDLGAEVREALQQKGDITSPGFLSYLAAIGQSGSIGDGGDNVLNGSSNSNDALFGLGGNDRLYGQGGDDALDGGVGDDYLVGGDGADTYVFGRGSGKDTINNWDTDAVGTKLDTIRIGAGVSPADVLIRREHVDLILSINGTSDEVRVLSYFDQGATSGYAVDLIKFADGTAWDIATVKAMMNVVTEGDDYLDGGLDDDTIDGRGGKDIIHGYAGNDTLIGGDGDDVIDGGVGNDVLSGGAGDDTLIGGTGDDVLDGGTGNDSLHGETGNDTYRFGRGSGQDTVLDYDFTAGNVDAVELAADVLPSDVTLTSDASHLYLTINGTTDKLTIQSFFVNDGYKVEQIKFADGTTWGLDAIRAEMLKSSDGNDVIFGFETDDLIDGGAGDDVITDYGGANVIDGGAGDDTITLSGNGNNTLEGGRGNDQLTGSLGSDTYVFNRGDGQDTISDFSGQWNWYWGTWYDSGRADSLRLGAGILPGDIRATRSGTDLVLTINDPSNSNPDPAVADRVTVQNWYANSLYRIEQLQFADGATLGTSDIQLDTSGADLLSGTSADSMLFAGAGNDVLQGGAGNDLVSDTSGNNLLDGGAGNDWLSGGSGNDLLIGRAGNDVIKGGAGTDVFAFNKGDGQDVVDATAGQSDALSLGGGITYQDLALSKQNDDLVVGTGNGESVTLKSWYVSSANHAVLNLQVIAEAMAGFDANSADPLLNKKVQTFDFTQLVNAFDAARAADPGLTSWALTNALTQYHLSGSDDAALGGDLAYQYGLNGTLAGIGFDKAQDVLNDPQFGAQAQALHPLSSLQDGAVRLS